MTDITKIAQACADRILDSILHLGREDFAISDSDVAQEVEKALREALKVEPDTNDGTRKEEIAGVGYINDDKEHVLISIRNPTLTSEYPKPDFVQFAVTMDNARELQTQLNRFILSHDVDIMPTLQQVYAAIDALNAVGQHNQSSAETNAITTSSRIAAET